MDKMEIMDAIKAIDEIQAKETIKQLYSVDLDDGRKRYIVVMAILQDQHDIVKLALDLRYDVNVNISGKNVLHLACACLNSRIVRLFLNRGFDMYEGAETGNGPLNALKTYYKFYSTNHLTHRLDVPEKFSPDDEVFKILKLFFDRGLVLHADNKNDRSIVEEILTHGTKEIVDLVAKHGYDYNYVDDTHRTILQALTRKGKPDVIEALLKYVDVNVKTRSLTALHVAVHYGKVENARVLLKNGADYYAVVGGAPIPFFLAYTMHGYGSDEICRLMILHRRGVNSILSNYYVIKSVIIVLSSKSKYQRHRTILAMHAIIMKSANFPIYDDVYSDLAVPESENINIPELEFACSKEIKKLNNTFITVGRTYYELMTGHTNDVVWWLTRDAQKRFETYPYDGAFILYSDTLYIAYKLALKRRVVFEMNGVLLLNLFFAAGVDFDIARLIIDYLNFDDLVNLILGIRDM